MRSAKRFADGTPNRRRGRRNNDLLDGHKNLSSLCLRHSFRRADTVPKNEMVENEGKSIRGSGLQRLGDSRDKHLHFLGAAPAQRKNHHCNFAWAIPEWMDCILNFPAVASELSIVRAENAPRLSARILDDSVRLRQCGGSSLLVRIWTLRRW